MKREEHNMKSTIVKCLMLAGAVALAGCVQKPMPPSAFNQAVSGAPNACQGACWTKVVPEIKNYEYKLSSDQKMREVISAAALKCYWYVAVQGPGELTLTYWGNDGKQVIYDVAYSKDGYTLTYGDSAFMNYDEATGNIHPLYDLWFHGGGQYGDYGLVPTLATMVAKASTEEANRAHHPYEYQETDIGLKGF